MSQVPRLEGRFPQLSGIRFSFDPSKPGGERVLRDTVMVAGPDAKPNGARVGL